MDGHDRGETSPRLTLGLTAISLLLVVAAACGDAAGGPTTETRVDPHQVETLLVQSVEDHSPDLSVSGATCPPKVPARSGDTFQCTVDVEGAKAGFTVQIAAVTGEQARYTFKPNQAIVDISGLSDFVRSQLDSAWQSAAIDCGKAKARLADVGDTIECTVFNGQTTRYITATVEDKDGSVSLSER